MSARPLRLSFDRRRPGESKGQDIAPSLYVAARELPIVSPHGRLGARMLLADEPFRDPAALLAAPDHYVTRRPHASGVALDRQGVGQGDLAESQSRDVWRTLRSRWHLDRGTPVRYWLAARRREQYTAADAPAASREALLRRVSGIESSRA